MFEKFFLFCRGYVILSLEENSKERFLNLCKARNIEITDILYINTLIYCRLSCKDYLKIKPVVKKTGCLPKIQKKAGAPFAFRKVRKRKGLLAGFLLAALIISQLTGRIWYIDVQGGFLHTREQIVRVLADEMQIYAGTGRETVDCREIEEQLRLLYNEIGWVSVEKSGCNLYIRLNESVMPEYPGTQEAPSHIIADKDGIVKRIEVLSGVAQVHVGDEVKKGDILISGIVPVIGDYEEVLYYQPVGAEGKVYLEAEFSYEAVYSMKYTEKLEKETKTGFSFFFTKKKLFSYIPRYSEGKYDIITVDIVPFVFLDYEVPFFIRKYEIREYETEIRQMEKTEAEERARAAWEKFLLDWEAQGVEIRNERFLTDISTQQCRATGTGIAYGNFISYQEIKEEEWNSKDEHSGDDS